MSNSLTDEPTTLGAAIMRYNQTGEPIPKHLRKEHGVKFVSGKEQPRPPQTRKQINRRNRVSSVPFSRLGGALPLLPDGRSPMAGSHMPTPHQNANIAGYKPRKKGR